LLVAARGFAGCFGAGFSVAGLFAAREAAVVAVDFGAGAARRVPIRSGRVEGSAASTPFSSGLAFDFCFLGLSTLSAIASRVYGSLSGRGARPPSIRHPDHRSPRRPARCGSNSRARVIDDHFRSS
jgi:hypothetical protein